MVEGVMGWQLVQLGLAIVIALIVLVPLVVRQNRVGGQNDEQLRSADNERAGLRSTFIHGHRGKYSAPET